MAIGDNTFTPKELSVPVGATVVWKHDGQRKHTVTADDNSFNSGTLEAGGNFSQTFDKPGTYAYFCEFHGGAGGGGMAGVIKVGDAAPAAVAPPPQPTAAPAPPPAAAVTAAMIDFDFDPKELQDQGRHDCDLEEQRRGPALGHRSRQIVRHDGVPAGRTRRA
ncbi:MAG: plastocyanin/azurin family copper-binding protein [Candidatus Competibacter sp.]